MRYNLFKIIISSIGGIILIREIIKELGKKRKYYFLKEYLKKNKYRFRSFPFFISIRNKNILNIAGKDEYSNRFCFTLSYKEENSIFGYLHLVYKLKNQNIGKVFNFLIPHHNINNLIPLTFKTDLLKERNGFIVESLNSYKFFGGKENLIYTEKIIEQLSGMEFVKLPFIKFNNKNMIIGFDFGEKINRDNISNNIEEGLDSLNKIISLFPWLRALLEIINGTVIEILKNKPIFKNHKDCRVTCYTQSGVTCAELVEVLWNPSKANFDTMDHCA